MKENYCYSCQKKIDHKVDLYYLFVYHNGTRIKRDTRFLHFCDECFHENSDSLMKERLKCLSNVSISGTNDDNWRTCPYCRKTTPYAAINTHFQISEILGSDVNSLILHRKCYHENIGITEDAYL